ncbi:uncharacterized protein LOC105696348 [Orussus abietinus]|uniref:uncharacterized protein LOC105696348 n=1 Tax=Orussus abietinus TaxID=222816 RepID=UPI000625268F|nr:uncharacterized protein LOC105696348 [Orussus abietinus]
MFEIDDLEFDEDLLRDINEKEETYFSQQIVDDEYSVSKKPRLEERINPPTLPENCSASKRLESSNRNLILENLKKNTVNSPTSAAAKLNSKPDFPLSGKELLLDRLKKIKEKSTNERSANISSIIKNVQTRPEKTNSTNVTPKVIDVAKPLTSEQEMNTRLQNSMMKEEKQNLGDSRTKMVLDRFKQHAAGTFEKPKFNPPTSSISSPAKQNYGVKKFALNRKFPGPAGLLPDNVTEIINIKLYEGLDEGEEKQNESAVSEYCSQRTKCLFSEGAWQRMLNDLEPGSLEGFEINNIKENAINNSVRSTKIPILAGIIEAVDYSFQDPKVVLKDFTGSIEATLHRDILTEYPNGLEVGIVLLLKNAGLLVTPGLINKDFYILVTTENIAGVYTNKEKKLSLSQRETGKFDEENADTEDNDLSLNTSRGNSFNKRNSRNNSFEDSLNLSHSKINPHEETSSKNKSETDDSDSDDGFSSDGERTNCISKDKKYFKEKDPSLLERLEKFGRRVKHDRDKEVLNKTESKHCAVPSTSNDFLEDRTRMESSDKVKISDEEKSSKNRIESKSFDSDDDCFSLLNDSILGDKSNRINGNSESDAEFKSPNLQDTLQRFSRTPKSLKKLTRTIECVESERNNKNQESSIQKKTIQRELTVPKNVNIAQNMNDAKEEKNLKSPGNSLRKETNSEITQNRVQEQNVEKKAESKQLSSLRAKLLQFKSNDVLTPPDRDQTTTINSNEYLQLRDSTAETSSNKFHSAFEDDLLKDSEDSDDELMSQLDLDSIMSNYNQRIDNDT